MEKGTSLWGDHGVTGWDAWGRWGGGWASPCPACPPPEQRGPQALVEASNAAAPQQVPGQLCGCGAGRGWSLHRGLGTPLARELGLGRQDLPLGSWGERGRPAGLPPSTGWGWGRGPAGVPPRPTSPTPSPRRPASWSWIFSISMGVVTITWQVPAPQPASISLNRVNFCLQ